MLRKFNIPKRCDHGNIADSCIVCGLLKEVMKLNAQLIIEKRKTFRTTIEMSNAHRLADLISNIQAKDFAVQIQKLSGSTCINDCANAQGIIDLMIEPEPRHLRPFDELAPMIKSLPFSVWRCKIGRSTPWFYGKTIMKAIEFAVAHQSVKHPEF